MYHVTPYAFSGLLAGISSVAFGIFVYLKSSNQKLGRIWCLFSFSVAGYGFGALWYASTLSLPEALLAWRLTFALGVTWIVSLFYHFVCTFCEIERPWSIRLHYLVGLAFLPIIPTHLFFRDVRWFFDSFYYSSAGALFPLFVIWWIGLVLYSHYVLVRYYQKVSAHKKQQIKYFFIAIAVSFSGGSLSYLPIFGIDLYPWGNFTVFLYPFIMSYAILKHNLMDVTLIIRKTLIYSMVTTALTVLYVGIAFSVARLVEGWIGSKVEFSYGIAACIVTVLSHPFLRRVQRFVDQRFSRASVNREEKLLELSNDILRQKSPEELCRSLLNVLEKALHPKQTALYLRSEKGTGFQRLSSGREMSPEMPDDNIWAAYFSQDTQPLIHPPVSYAGHPRQILMEALIAEMKRYQMAAAFPLGSQKNPLGYLFLGEKKSEAPYDADDLLLLRNALNQTTMAYERYLLDRGLQEAPQALETMASSFVHEIKMPMTNIKLPADLVLLYLKDIESGKRSITDLLPAIKKHMEYIQGQSVAAVEKIDAIRQMSKNQKDNFTRLAPVELIKGSLSTLDQLIQQSHIGFTVTIPDNLPVIYGNPQQLGIVFMNLVKNGIEAMVNDTASVRPKTLRVAAHQEKDSIVISIEDAGPGIKPENINRLFQMYFSTKGSQGTGMGLFLAQEVIKAHGGTIDVSSQYGQGTRFVVRLPIYREQTHQAVA